MLEARLLPVGDIAPQDWERCMPGEAEGHAYYAACEDAPPIGFTLTAVAAFASGGSLVALSPVFRLDYNLATGLQGGLRRVADSIAALFPRLLRLSVIGLGSPLGERCHLGFDPGLDQAGREAALASILAVLTRYAAAERIGLVAVKDLAEPDDAQLRGYLSNLGFAHVNSLPVAVLDIGAGGEEAYLARLSSSTRKDLRRKLKKSGPPVVECRRSAGGNAAEISALYHATRTGSSLDYGEFEDLPDGYFERVLNVMGDRAFLMLYRINGTLVAFNLMFQDHNRLIDKFWGAHKETARAHDLYFVSWMENIRYCILHGIPLLQTGQTAYAAKIRLGSRLVPGHVWFRHRNHALHFILQFVSRYIAFDRMDKDLKHMKTDGSRTR